MSPATSPDLTFTPDELDLLGRTADALSAYLGKAVLAEVVDASETGFEWVIFAVPLDTNDSDKDKVTVQIGGHGARLIGGRGGLEFGADTYTCEYLWAIQLSDIENIRFIKVNQDGDEVAWSDDLRNVLPFEISEPPEPDDDTDDDSSEDGDTGDDRDTDPDDDSRPDDPPQRTLH